MKGAVIGSFLHFFLFLCKKMEEVKRPGCHLLEPSFWNWFKALRTDCGAERLVNEHSWQ